MTWSFWPLTYPAGSDAWNRSACVFLMTVSASWVIRRAFQILWIKAKRCLENVSPNIDPTVKHTWIYDHVRFVWFVIPLTLVSRRSSLFIEYNLWVKRVKGWNKKRIFTGFTCACLKRLNLILLFMYHPTSQPPLHDDSGRVLNNKCFEVAIEAWLCSEKSQPWWILSICYPTVSVVPLGFSVILSNFIQSEHQRERFYILNLRKVGDN